MQSFKFNFHKNKLYHLERSQKVCTRHLKEWYEIRSRFRVLNFQKRKNMLIYVKCH